MTSRVLLIDVPRGPFSSLARELPGLGCRAERFIREVDPSVLSDSGLLGALVHHKRASLIHSLSATPGLATMPTIIWYPRSASDRVLSSWNKSGAIDFMVGPANAREVVARLKGLGDSARLNAARVDEAMRGFSRISQAVSAGKDDFTVLSTTAREIERVFSGVHCSIMTVSTGGEAGMVITQGDMPEPLDIPLDIRKYPEIQKMLSTRRPVAIKDVRRHPLMREVRDLLMAKDLVSILTVPIFFRDEVIGLIMLRSVGKPRAFNRTEISFFEMIAQSAAAALANIRLGREVEVEAKRTREARRLAKKTTTDLARLEAIIERAADGILIVDQEGGIKTIDVNFSRLSGYEKGDLEGRMVDEVMSPSTGDDLAVIEAIAGGKTIRANQTLKVKHGDAREVAVRVEPIPRRPEWLISMHDMTEERRLDEALRRTKDFLENVINSSMDAIISADTKGVIILFNQAAEAISGYKAHEVIGKMNIVDFYSPGVARDIMKKLRDDGYGGKGKLETCYNVII